MIHFLIFHCSLLHKITMIHKPPVPYQAMTILHIVCTFLRVYFNTHDIWLRSWIFVSCTHIPLKLLQALSHRKYARVFWWNECYDGTGRVSTWLLRSLICHPFLRVKVFSSWSLYSAPISPLSQTIFQAPVKSYLLLSSKTGIKQPRICIPP